MAKNLLNLTLAGLPEWSHFPTADSRQRALDEFGRLTGRWWSLIPGVLIVLAAALLARYLTRFVIGSLISGVLHRVFVDLLVLAVSFLAAFGVMRFLHRRGAARWLRGRLIDDGVPICVRCGYSLRGLAPSAATCPECGHTIDDRTRSLLARGESGSAS